MADRRPLVVHVVYRFAVGGLENGVANLVNRMDPSTYRHAIVALTGITNFRQRIARDDVEFFALNKAPGHATRLYPQIYHLFRRLGPAIVHTRNLAALEVLVPAWAARVAVRIHGEHGRELADPDGESLKHQLIRRIYRPFVTKYVALSRNLESYLQRKVGVPPERIEQIYNGVDTDRFRMTTGARAPIPDSPFQSPDLWIVGTVGRMDHVKHQTNLARAFVSAVKSSPDTAHRLRLVMVGDGPLRQEVKAILDQGGVSSLAWLPGERNDVAEVMRGLDCFVLPSIAEGISNTILEAMASGLPVIATHVGGNGELVDEGTSGMLVPARDSEALSAAILRYFRRPVLGHRHGASGRALVERRFSLDAMVNRYQSLYDQCLGTTRPEANNLVGFA